MPDDTAAASTQPQALRDEQRSEHWPLGGKPCYGPAAWSIVTPWCAAFYHACEAHRDAVDTEVKVRHLVMPVAEWRASSRGYRPGLAGS